MSGCVGSLRNALIAKSLLIVLVSFVGQLGFGGVASAATVGEPAAPIKAQDTNGRDFTLSDVKGKIVVLEWHNQGCPFVKKHYDSRNMQNLQKQLTSRGVLWVTVISSAPGKQGHVTPAQANEYVKSKGATPSAVLLDPKGEIGKAYGAKTTPHMYVIDEKGILVYDGAIDDNDSTDPKDAAKAHNHVLAAVKNLWDRKPVKVSTTRPYGCSVKYAD